MPAHRSTPVAPLVVAALVLGATFASAVPADSDAVRLRRDSAAVERELLARDVSRLAPAQRDDVVVYPTIPTGYLIGTGVVIAGGLSTMAINASLLRPGMSRQVSGLLGIGVGVVGLALGVSTLSDVGVGDGQQTLAPERRGRISVGLVRCLRPRYPGPEIPGAAGEAGVGGPARGVMGWAGGRRDPGRLEVLAVTDKEVVQCWPVPSVMRE